MIRVRHRRRLRSFRFLAVAAPLVAIGVTAAAYALQGRWWWVAAAAGATLSTLLGAAILRLDRRWRVLYATGRAAQAAAFAADHEQYADEHRSFAAHMLELLDEASDRIGVQRMTLDLLERELADLRARTVVAEPEPVAKGPGHVVDVLGEVPEWTDLWPDASEAPTVVDLVAWDERGQTDSGSGPADAVVERSA
ncbi:MAG TPA: hypothetical protein VHI11_04690 [Jiangellaceae bacterium]|jgi:hypothetical protein|nr:hypothetical protein [Jiangellaceae bacterium]